MGAAVFDRAPNPPLRSNVLVAVIAYWLLAWPLIHCLWRPLYFALFARRAALVDAAHPI